MTDHSLQMDIESRIRSRIDEILRNEARSSAALTEMAADDEPPVLDPRLRERDLYERIILTYRSAVTEVNAAPVLSGVRNS